MSACKANAHAGSRGGDTTNTATTVGGVQTLHMNAKQFSAPINLVERFSAGKRAPNREDEYF